MQLNNENRSEDRIRVHYTLLLFLKGYRSKSVLLKKCEVHEVNKEVPQTFFLNSLYSQKRDLILFIPYQWQPCILQF